MTLSPLPNRNDRYDLLETNYPCPEPGWEHAIIEFKWHGRPAHWEDGNVWALKENLPTTQTWIDKLDLREEARRKGKTVQVR